jgi:hypothetical protein
VARVDRRRFLLLAAAAPLLLSTSAEAALKMPTKAPPARVRPLGRWRLLDTRPTVESGPGPAVATVLLEFRPDIDAATPYINVWPARIPLPPLPPPAPPVPGQPRFATPIPVGSPYRPAERPFDFELLGGVTVIVPVEVVVEANSCSGSHRITVQMSDGPTDERTAGPTRRRAVFSFMLRVVGLSCYVSRVPDPELPDIGRPINVRPTSRPAATKTPRLPPFRTATPTPRP